MNVRAELHRQVLEVSRQKVMPGDLSLANPVVVRQPWLWLAFFESRELKGTHFTTIDGTTGLMATRFNEAASKIFSGCAVPPFILPEVQKADVASLTQSFSSLGTLWCRVPLAAPDAAGVEVVIRDILNICRAIIEVAQQIVGRLNSRTISLLGGSGERYTAAKLLDPALFPDEDADALKRATTKAEAPLDARGGGGGAGGGGGGKRSRSKRTVDPRAKPGQDICSHCGDEFPLGKFQAHRKAKKCC